MQSIRAAPSRLYWFISGLIEMLLIFFLSIFKLSKPSDSLTRDDINNIRRGNNPDGHNGNDFRYRGNRGIYYSMQGPHECTWADEAVEVDRRREEAADVHECWLGNSQRPDGMTVAV